MRMGIDTNGGEISVDHTIKDFTAGALYCLLNH